MRLIAAAVLLLASSASAQPCTVTIASAVDPRCEARGANCGPSGTSDSSLWFRATMAGECGSRPAAWSVTPGMPDGWIDGWHRDPDAVECGDGWCAARSILRGPAGLYRVTATSESGASTTIDVEIPLPPGRTDRRQPFGLGPQCAGRAEPITIGALREAIEGLADADRVALLIDGKVARLATVAAPGCWAQGNARGYGIEHCDTAQQADVLALF